jgi:hypothetical protein
MLKDLYLHQKYLAQDNPILLKDLLTLFPDKTRMLLQGETELAGEVETALNQTGEYLQKNCHKKFFEFFYPSLSVPLYITAFAPFDDLGESSYSAEWTRFSEHRPLKQFLGALTLYLYSRLKGSAEWPSESAHGSAPPWNSGPHPWRRLIDEALGFPAEPDAPPSPAAPPDKKAAAPEVFRIEAEKLPLLREESDMVRELLRIEADDVPESKTVEKAGKVSTAEYAERRQEAAGEAGYAVDAPPEKTTGFFAGLDGTERAALSLIARNGTREELEALAKTEGTMPELLVDGINEKFQDRFGDLLIDTESERPVIQSEYEEMVKTCLHLC